MKIKHTDNAFESCDCFKHFLKVKNLSLFKWTSLPITRQVAFYEGTLKADLCSKDKVHAKFDKLVEARTNTLAGRGGVNPDVINTVAEEVKDANFKITRKTNEN